MPNTPARVAASAAALVCLSFAAAQPPAPPTPGQRPPTIEERVAVLERGLASVTTRFELRDSASTGASSGSIEPRLAALERAVERLNMDLQRVERQADGAARDASDARRTAMDADRIARDVQMRVR